MEYVNLIRDLSIDNKYTRWYCSIISRASGRSSDRKTALTILDGYSELHHIVPECFFIDRVRAGPKGILEGDPEDKNNKVYLSGKEHFICHWLLTKMFTKKFFRIKSEYAFIGFAFDKTNERNLSGRQYELIRKYKAKTSSITNNKLSAEGKHNFQSEKHRKDTSARSIARGKKLMETGEHPFQRTEVREKAVRTNLEKSKNGTHPFQQEFIREKAQATRNKNNKPKIESGTYVLQRKDVREENSRRVKERNSKTVVCPHCDKHVLYLNAQKWHFDRCKYNKDSIREVFNCPHCLKSGTNKSNMLRYHFDNCKHKLKEDHDCKID